MDDMNKKAQLDVLREMRKSAMSEMGGKMGGVEGLKKVTVAAPSKAGLAEGLEKAEEMLGKMPSSDDMRDEPSYEEETEQKLMELVEHCKSAEDLDKKIEFLQKAKEMKFPSQSEEMSSLLDSEEVE